MLHGCVCDGLLQGIVIVTLDVIGSSGLYHSGIIQTSAKVRLLCTPSIFGFFSPRLEDRFPEWICVHRELQEITVACKNSEVLFKVSISAVYDVQNFVLDW